MERIACLMYHEIQAAGRLPCSSDPGYLRYVVSEGEFRTQMSLLSSLGVRGVSVRDAGHTPGQSVAITFDDGTETDLLVAAPILREFGHGATFFVSSGLLNQPGYLTDLQLRELHALGFEIGSHGATHRYLSDLPAAALRSEVHGSKERIEASLGAPIISFSCPGGRWNDTVLAAVWDAGFESFSTSDVGTNRRHEKILRRIAIQRGLMPMNFREFVDGRGLGRHVLKAKALRAVKAILGNTLYDRLWRRVQALRG
jgi:peptidoglycan/xylan/chitin deacetylase (PgdA/CDA1 family)